jgi:hypothetical protein
MCATWFVGFVCCLILVMCEAAGSGGVRAGWF